MDCDQPVDTPKRRPYNENEEAKNFKSRNKRRQRTIVNPASGNEPAQRHIVAIKSDNGDVGFVAVRKSIAENPHKPNNLDVTSAYDLPDNQRKSATPIDGLTPPSPWDNSHLPRTKSCDHYDYDFYGETYYVSDFDLPVNNPASGAKDHDIKSFEFDHNTNYSPHALPNNPSEKMRMELKIDNQEYHQPSTSRDLNVNIRRTEPFQSEQAQNIQMHASTSPWVKANPTNIRRLNDGSTTTPRNSRVSKTGIVNPAYSTIRRNLISNDGNPPVMAASSIQSPSQVRTTENLAEMTEVHSEDDTLMETDDNLQGNSEEKQEVKPTIKLPPYCKFCGQNHGVTENHEYDYVDEIDEDLMCDICLQPFIDPYDTKCGHTFCSICIKNYLRVQHMCPIDRQEMTNTSSDCWQSSLILRKLLNKLLVICPNEKFCKEKVSRCELEAHLKERCPGHVVRCCKYDCGCTHKAPRSQIKLHEQTCQYKNTKIKSSVSSSKYEEINIDLFRPEGTAELGLQIVGGSDTPIPNIVLQDILPGSLIEEDGRLQVGDIIVELNGEELYLLRHVDVRVLFTKPMNVMKFKVLREKFPTASVTSPTVLSPKSPVDSNAGESMMVSLLKPPTEQLGIKISFGKNNDPGVYIVELVEGQVAYADGRLLVGDKILAIGSNDLRNSNPEHAAKVIQSSGERVDIFVSRKSRKASVIPNEWADGANSETPKKVDKPISAKLAKDKKSYKPMKRQYVKKMVSVTKSSKEGLGFIVSGGLNSPRGNLPIFVQDVLPMSILGKDKRVKRGDLLVEINGTDLSGLTHSQAMAVLRESVQRRDVKLVVIELEYDGMAEDISLWDELTSLHQHPTSWAPSWKMWLFIPNDYRIARDIFIKKCGALSNAIKVVGGLSKKGHQTPVFITYVSTNPIYSALVRSLKCGDEILAINKHMVNDLPLSEITDMFKSDGAITLTIISWPGSLH